MSGMKWQMSQCGRSMFYRGDSDLIIRSSVKGTQEEDLHHEN